MLMKEFHDFILVSTEMRQKLKEALGVSEATISDSLNFRRHSLRSRRIRSASINVYNGVPFL